ncbi:zinc finger MYM-type protein 1-like protein [Tanacetum coccineum]
MENYFKRKTPSTPTSDDVTKQATKEKPKQPIDVIDLNNLPWDPIDRPRISQYNVNQKDDIRRKYWNRGPCQPSGHDFKRTIIVIASRYCLNGELPFRGHDEKATSLYMGNFLELRKLIGKLDKNIGEVLKRTPKNCQLNSPQIQKEIADCFKDEVLQIIFKEIGDDVFSLLVDESSDVTKKEQMAIVLRYVNKSGVVKESLVGVVHVKETSSSYLKASIDSFFANHNLSLKQLRGQGYDGASNMRGEFNGLKAKILKENNSAYYVHCFAHQLQLVVVAVARKHLGVVDFFDKLTLVTNVVCTSCKRKDILIDSEKERVEKAIGNGEVETGRGKNQELSLIRAGDTRWNSHYKTILRLIDLLPSVIKVLEFVENEGNDGSRQNQASGILVYFESFDFVFYLHMMKYILGLTNILSQSLQKDDQDIVEAVSVVQSTKEQLKEFRLNGFVPLLDTISSFCIKHNIRVVNMDEAYVSPNGRRRRVNISNRRFFEVECFNTVVDMQIQEFNDRFSEASTELLRNMAWPCDSFSQFNTSKLVRLSDLYPNDFDTVERMELESQLNLYYANVTKDDSFVDLNGITDLAIMMVKKRKHISYPLVYRLLKLALVLPIATASVERCFSAMKIIKSDLRNRIGQGFLNSCVICGVEREALANVNNEDEIKQFPNMTDRKGHL